MASSRLHNFPLLKAEEIENTPSRQDGVSAAKEARLWKKIGSVIFETAKMVVPPMSSGTAAIAMTFSARFFTLKSLTKNSPPLIAAAALILAGKCNDEPRRLMNLTVEIMKQWYGRQNPDLRSKFSSQEYLDSLLSRVEEAELVLMFTLTFDFNVDPLVVEALYKIKETDCLASALKLASFQQFLVSSSNDIMRRDAGMVLQYRGEDIALAICQLFFKVSKQRGVAAAAALEPPADSATGVAWYVKHGLTEEIHRQISGRFHKLYANVQKNEGGVDGLAATTAAGGGGGADSAGLTDGEALGNGDGGGDGAATRSVGGGRGAGINNIPAYASTSPREHDTLQQQKVGTLDGNTEKLKPTAGGGGGGRRMISMDRATTVSHASTKPPPAKRPCSWADEPVIPHPVAGTAGWVGSGTGTTPPAPAMSLGGSIPSSSQQQQQKQQQYHSKSVYTNYAPPSLNRNPAGGGGYQPHRTAAVAGPAPAEDSEPEEGELEEGEIR
ncbi:hypothetical protein Ndes2526B_g02862 [Nannochloris sp. 'desiccata']|nr:hypothetical protein NADE_004630 [Chlorella desiccata (nom. nud.)]